ncbi:MAG: diguanylate cyclase [Planctomycetes bacterium]|nr:diguanylate cyclase [Planctomycetota bacterium]
MSTARSENPGSSSSSRTGTRIRFAGAADTRAEVDALRGRVAYLEGILRHSPDMIVTTDAAGRIVEFSTGAERMLGWRRSEVVGKPAAQFYVDPPERDRIMHLVQSQGAVVDYEIRIRRRSGSVLHISLTLSRLFDSAGRFIGTVGISKDITKRKELERRLRKLALTDPLTGLFNRGTFNTRLREEVEEAQRLHRPLALLMIDLDGFKEYNDTKGHLEGDNALREVGRVLRKHLQPPRETGFRYGGDEFVGLLRSASVERARAVAEQIRAEIASKLAPHVFASIGINGLTALQGHREFIRCADEAMYRAKQGGGNRCCVH